MFDELKIDVLGVIDQHNEIKQGKWQKNCMVAVCVAMTPYRYLRYQLYKAGFNDVVPVWDVLDYYSDKTKIYNGWRLPYAKNYYRRRLDTISRKFEVGPSREHYRYFTGWRSTPFDYEQLIRDLGTGYPTLPSTLADIRARQVVNIYPDAPMKAISIHNEGYELETIERNMHLFQKYRPQIDVACYHTTDGLWEIENALTRDLEDYVFLFRVHAYMGQAAVMWCVPKERLKK
jgi:hypothetical protein